MIIFEKSNLGKTSIKIVIHNSGSIFTKPGVAYFLTHIFNTKGSVEKKEKIYSILEEDAIEFSTSVNKEFLTINIEFLNEKEKKALKLLKEILTSPNITNKSFETSKKEIISKIKNKKNDNDYLASINLYKAIFKNTPAKYPVIGENIENITIDDVKNFYSSIFENSTITMIGGKNINVDEITSLFKQTNKSYPFFIPKNQKDTILKKEVEQSFIHFASFFDVDYKNEIHLAKIATFILGAGGFGSRIMEEIRVKRGYAYSAYATNNFKKIYKLLNGYLQTKLQNTNNAINLIKEIINDFYEKGITKKELELAKKFLIGSEPLRNETINQRLLRKFNEIYLNLPKDYYKKELELINNTKLDEVNEFIKNHKEIKNITFSIVTK